MTERKTTYRSRSLGQRTLPSMSEQQLQAYLLARETVRRIQRTSALFCSGPGARPRPASPSP